jgi:hypothetical protein
LTFVSGQCTPTCPPGQVYNTTTKTCRCLNGLALLPNNQCGLCALNTVIDPVSLSCVPCRSN